MRAGEMRHRVTFQSRVTTKDSYGQPLDVWADMFTTWASLDDTRAREMFSGQKFLNEIQLTVRVRYRREVNESWRIKHSKPDSGGDELFGILGIVRPQRIRREMILACRQLAMGEPTS
jgi:SPP1 family predicted phage head-tail adaptor